MNSSFIKNQFKRNVEDKYVIYNSLFAALPFSGVANVGALLPILAEACKNGYAAGQSPNQIIEDFFNKQTNITKDAEKFDRLFKFVQYIERQVVLFDAIEDAAFGNINETGGAGSLKSLLQEATFAGKGAELKEHCKNNKVRIVLTAHPTQFYPGSVLGIIHDMGEAIAKNDFQIINQYIQQLALTPFFNKKQPTPYDEAVNVMWYLENVFYRSIGNIYNFIVNEMFEGVNETDNTFIELGFWPGGDRDGNPNVQADTTLKVAAALRSAIVVCYYRDIRRLKRKLTFSGVDSLMLALESLLYENVFRPSTNNKITTAALLEKLEAIKKEIKENNHGLFVSTIESLINKVKLFGTHFASLDIRQDSRIHTATLDHINQAFMNAGQNPIFPEGYTSLSENEKIEVLEKINATINPEILSDPLAKDTLQSMQAMQTIQLENGVLGCHRYIISNCQSALHMAEVYALFTLSGWKGDKTFDIVPLFETIDDLAEAAMIMGKVYEQPFYKSQLADRRNEQTIMLGFSDGTKDGGYLEANWSIYKAKEKLTAISRQHGCKVKFFDGRGGPPSRGGGKTHQFYASLGKDIEHEEIHLTVQGQTITSNFGTIQSAQYNIEQLLSAGMSSTLFADNRKNITEQERALLDTLSKESYESYQSFKAHPLFLKYLEEFSPLTYYSKSNIASRPAKRSAASATLQFSDLRAIPFVGSWSQLKQNVPGYFGLGAALKKAKESGNWESVKHLFKNVSFFKTLIDNSMMSMLKSYFELTQFIKDDPTYSPIWKLIKDEFDTTQELVLELSENKILMGADPAARASILMRDDIVLPLLTIQQYALWQLHKETNHANNRAVYEKLVTRTMFGIINAARNSA
jgi:phosphoenolpyruvate carboxylase